MNNNNINTIKDILSHPVLSWLTLPSCSWTVFDVAQLRLHKTLVLANFKLLRNLFTFFLITRPKSIWSKYIVLLLSVWAETWGEGVCVCTFCVHSPTIWHGVLTQFLDLEIRIYLSPGSLSRRVVFLWLTYSLTLSFTCIAHFVFNILYILCSVYHLGLHIPARKLRYPLTLC